MAKYKKTVVEQSRKIVVEINPRSFISEQFRTTRTNINFSMPAGELRTLLFTSSIQAEGKSTVSVNIAHLLAQEGKRVLLVDSDMRKPTLHMTMNSSNTLGLSNYLTDNCLLNDAVQDAETPNLSFMTSGPIPPNPSELLASGRFDKMLDELKTRFDMIIFDAPPLLSVTDSQILANKSDGTVLIVRAGKTPKDSVKRAKELLVSSQAKILGVILNQFIIDKDHYYYYQYYGNSK